jgi:hypothetical protein
MKKQQTGEVILVMMVVMLAIVLLSRGHMGMMGYDGDHVEKPTGQAQQATSEQIQSPPPGESAKRQD